MSSDDTEDRRVTRRDALKKVAAVGGALWLVPAVQTVNMDAAWAAVGSRSQRCYTVRIDVGRNGFQCSEPIGGCRCLNPESLAGGCSMVSAAAMGGNAGWIVRVEDPNARIIEGFSTCGGSSGSCRPGYMMGTNAMQFRAHPGTSGRNSTLPVSRIEVSFCIGSIERSGNPR